MNSNLGVLGTLLCVALAWGVGCCFGATGAVIGGIFFFVVLINIIAAYQESKKWSRDVSLNFSIFGFGSFQRRILFALLSSDLARWSLFLFQLGWLMKKSPASFCWMRRCWLSMEISLRWRIRIIKKADFFRNSLAIHHFDVYCKWLNGMDVHHERKEKNIWSRSIWMKTDAVWRSFPIFRNSPPNSCWLPRLLNILRWTHEQCHHRIYIDIGSLYLAVRLVGSCRNCGVSAWCVWLCQVWREAGKNRTLHWETRRWRPS